MGRASEKEAANAKARMVGNREAWIAVVSHVTDRLLYQEA